MTMLRTDLVTSPKARPSLRKYTTTPTPPIREHKDAMYHNRKRMFTFLSTSHALFDGINEVRLASADVRTKDIGTITFVMDAQRKLFALVVHVLWWANWIHAVNLHSWLSESTHIRSQMYTVRFPIGGRNTLISGRVMSSGYIPPVSSNRARLKRLSELYEK